LGSALLKRPTRRALLILTFAAVVAVAAGLSCRPILYGLGIWLFGGPQSDRQLIGQRFDTALPVFSEIAIVGATGDATNYDDPRKIVVHVVIDGYPEPISCHGEVVYFHGDPSFVSLSWSDDECELQDRSVRQAQRVLEEYYASGPLPANAELLAQLLEQWILRDWIVLSDIKQPEMRAMVSSLLERE
jgi:hypothetical protein